MHATQENPAAREDADVVIIGAGPVGLTLANTLGLAGVRVIVAEKLPQIIDYPRAIGIDDESLRTLQTAGLSDQVQAHITPHHWMRFFTASGQCFASIEPRTDEFGWSRRNAFIQPQVDDILYRGLQRFEHVQVLLGQELQSFTQDDTGVVVVIKNSDGLERTLRAKYLVASDGGNSLVRRRLNVPFEGRTKPNQWIVVDVRNDPLGTPHIDMHCDPERPYVSAALPHGIRRFEFMVMPGETEEELSKPENLAQLMRKVVPEPDKVDYIRKRVYTHNARLAAQFRIGRILLAGDAAHIMPVWQGQGYNSGMRDASNLAWKLALVVKGEAGSGLLDSYEQERRDHARSMIHLSEVAGDIFAPESHTAAKVRDTVMLALNAVPPVKQYFAEMRFKPMPRYEQGVVLHHTATSNQGARAPFAGLIDRSGNTPLSRLVGLMAEKKESFIGRLIHGLEVAPTSPVGRMFIQPRVATVDRQSRLLDDFIGLKFCILAWGTDPTYGMDEQALSFWQRLDARFIRVMPTGQLQLPTPTRDGVLTLGDEQGRIKDWFSAQGKSVVFVRPDRFVAAMASPQEVSAVTRQMARVIHAPLEA
ncbi:MAG: bifunctional 3-(3-hydroxy-phenyl)propionate/3-hydroxycinnamic acid hydroxylase [Comamonas sp.]|jgi:3-(3-hydroxy-phenyl)propionate hydroxylase|uniref:bifunctional 3-(3-hydroxy-phenyl)propionate/3-hydroxycinnamic acid hydroxylase MhpA n=1 Tax=Comamonas sp. TaxID=34028 RepID=UPI0028291D0B|nr:bifunctional 3-(3-hydroxy-phenyl)propionate/3-hydroxycinnamic acid hydroxylase [Comamonas sp.]MDR0216016.1 bifunctional 3-(3-hydroxy-phenyl)propionate/3-hydroxycinnamic acid hydroxylase [Comamonas sp.]